MVDGREVQVEPARQRANRKTLALPRTGTCQAVDRVDVSIGIARCIERPVMPKVWVMRELWPLSRLRNRIHQGLR
jgi:hypothetical protein